MGDLHTPWRVEFAKSPQQNLAFPVYIVDCTGRKIGTVWGPTENRENIALLWSKAHRIAELEAENEKLRGIAEGFYKAMADPAKLMKWRAEAKKALWSTKGED